MIYLLCEYNALHLLSICLIYASCLLMLTKIISVFFVYNILRMSCFRMFSSGFTSIIVVFLNSGQNKVIFWRVCMLTDIEMHSIALIVIGLLNTSVQWVFSYTLVVTYRMHYIARFSENYSELFANNVMNCHKYHKWKSQFNK